MKNKFNKIISYYKDNVKMDSDTAWEVIHCLGRIIVCDSDLDKTQLWSIMRDVHEKLYGKHFDEHYATWEVDQMYHICKDNHREDHSIMFTIDEATEIHHKYFKHKKTDVTCWDMYVALNAQYHDNIELYKVWFSDNTIEQLRDKIVESCCINWFEDVDASDVKVWNYFKKV